MREQVGHLERAADGLGAFADTGLRLLDAIEREQAERDRDAGLEGRELEAAGGLARDVVEVRRIPANDASERDDAREPARLGERGRGKWELESAVASTMKGHPEFLVMEIAGHADERSTDEHNLNLTKLRAAAVMAAMQQRGVNTKRLVSQGYGEYCALDAASNPAAWEKNRRVEFKIVKTDEGNTGVARGCETARNKGVIPPVVP